MMYHNDTGGGPSHGHRQHAQKNWQRSLMWFRRYPHTQTDTHIQTISSQYFAATPMG